MRLDGLRAVVTGYVDEDAPICSKTHVPLLTIRLLSAELRTGHAELPISPAVASRLDTTRRGQTPRALRVMG